MPNITRPVLWDAEFLKGHAQDAIERASQARSQQDWQIAETARTRCDSASRPG
jgi:hypothetical protein